MSGDNRFGEVLLAVVKVILITLGVVAVGVIALVAFVAGACFLNR